MMTNGFVQWVVLSGLLMAGFVMGSESVAQGHGGAELKMVLLPVVLGKGGTASCPSLPGVSYSALSITGPVTDRPAEFHPDLNLALRGYVPTESYLGLVNIAGPADLRAPQLAGLFLPRRVPAISAVYRVRDWDWPAMIPGAPLTNPPVTLMQMATTSGEVLHAPDSGYDLGDGYQMLVLYASAERLTLKYTREDNVKHGYTIHLEGICVEPRLRRLYEDRNRAGRSELPALRNGQPIGTARSDSVGVAVRDSGTFLDPRSRKDWWQRL